MTDLHKSSTLREYPSTEQPGPVVPASKISRHSKGDLVYKTNRTIKASAWRVHALWRLLRRALVRPGENWDTLAEREFEGWATISNVRALCVLGEEFKFVEPKVSEIKLTVAGEQFAKLKHWRAWSPPPEFNQSVKRLKLDGLFLGQGYFNKRPIVVDLFAGVGGLGLGFEAEGFAVGVAIDNDPEAQTAHQKNFPESKVIDKFDGDINKIAKDPKRYLCADTGIDPSKIVGVIGGPPCQGFSYIGERTMGDERSLLTSKFMDVVIAIEPDFFVLENVPGLLNIGKVPQFGIYMSRLAKGIGEPAAEIAEQLPRPPTSQAKRGRQYRRRLVSGAILRVTEELRTRKTLEDNPKLVAKAIVETFRELKRSLLTAVETCYSGANKKMARKIVHGSGRPLIQVAFGAVAQKLFESNGRHRRDLEDFLKTAVQIPSITPEIRATFNDVVAKYDSAPRERVFQGETIGPILYNLIKRASSKYKVTVPKTLNSVSFGTPQSRARAFLVGIHKKHKGKTFSFPTEKYSVTNESGNEELFQPPNPPTCSDAIGDIPDIDGFDFLATSDELPAKFLNDVFSPYAGLKRLETFDPTDKSLPRPDWNPFLVDGLLRCLHAPHALERIRKTPEGKQDKVSHRTRLHRARVSNTLRAGTREGRGSHTAVRPLHYEHDRVISVREGARIMGYPDWMIFHRTKWHGFRLVGNGVTFEVGRAIAANIYKLIFQANRRKIKDP